MFTGKMGSELSRPPRVLSHVAFSLLCLFFSCLSSQADAIRTQTLDLEAGWNAVYLEVTPLDGEPSSLFAGTPVGIAATYSAPPDGAQFVEDPSAGLNSAYGWSVWYAPDRDDSILTDLYSLQGNQPYLIHSETNVSLNITGNVSIRPPQWTPNAFNFVGFTLQHPGAPTFHQFFSPSLAHRHNKIYRMQDGTWRQVLEPQEEVMRSGEAFWIFCEGHSSYPGPLEVSVSSVLGVVLDSRNGSEISFKNHADYPVSFWVDHQPDQNTAIPMQTVIRAVDTDQKTLQDLTLTFPPGSWTQPFPALESGAAIRLPLWLDAKESPPGMVYSLLRIQSDIGTEIYIPVTAYMEDLD